LAVNPFIADTNIFAQGIYSRNVEASENGDEDENSTGNNDNRGLFRAGSRENQDDSGLANKISPVKDGWEIVAIAGIGYGFFIIAKRRKK
ncbi:MAG: hypothetical protein LBP72_03565, partial [Dysgonamonadaceae bacterium]|jgi:hypothetical protein|nr:hypothetical protein [Dysgonamonadaceae bacterium]